MTEVFADTFYFLALLGSNVAEHQRAVEATRDRTGQLVTTAWIVAELGNALCQPSDRQLFLQTLQALQTDSSVILLPPESNLFESGVNLFADRPDKGWSLTDCISFVAMSERGITDALTGDHHFEQAGFKALLK